jgi:hypothetical protein
MRKIPSRDISVHVGYLDLRASLVAEGVSWSPDVASDMVNRMSQLWENTLRTGVEYGMFEGNEDEEEYEAATPDGELHNPNVVYVEDGDEDG